MNTLINYFLVLDNSLFWIPTSLYNPSKDDYNILLVYAKKKYINLQQCMFPDRLIISHDLTFYPSKSPWKRLEYGLFSALHVFNNLLSCKSYLVLICKLKPLLS